MPRRDSRSATGWILGSRSHPGRPARKRNLKPVGWPGSTLGLEIIGAHIHPVGIRCTQKMYKIHFYTIKGSNVETMEVTIRLTSLATS
jgi:hypothetical protein